jgi:hypothetical protein
VAPLPLWPPKGKAADGAEVAASREALEELEHGCLAFAPDYEGRVVKAFFGTETGVRAAEDDRDPSRAQKVGQTVRPRSRRSGSRYANDVGGQALAQVYGSKKLAVDLDIVAGPSQQGTDQGQAETRQHGVVVDRVAGRTGLDEAYSHAVSSPPDAARDSRLGATL